MSGQCWRVFFFATAEFWQTHHTSTKIREKNLLGQNWAKNHKILNEQVLYQMKLQEVLMTIPTIGHQWWMPLWDMMLDAWGLRFDFCEAFSHSIGNHSKKDRKNHKKHAWKKKHASKLILYIFMCLLSVIYICLHFYMSTIKGSKSWHFITISTG